MPPGRPSLLPLNRRHVTRDDLSAHPVVTSSTNPHIKLMRSLVRRKVRQSERAFLVEGRRLVEDAIRQGAIPRSLLVRADVPHDWLNELAIPPERVRFVETSVFEAASDVEHSQGVAAIFDLPEPADDLAGQLAASDMPVLILDRLRDPGNMGTSLRSAAAAGVEVVLTGHGSVDPMSPKVVRAGMGAHFRLRIAPLTPQLTSALIATGRDIAYADAAASVPFYAYDWSRAAALVVGGETEPLSSELVDVVTTRVSIPMRANVESLNAGVAASVLLFEALRQSEIRRGVGVSVDNTP